MPIFEIAGVMFLATVFRMTFGFGEALLAVPVLALIIPIKVAAPVAVLASIVIAGFVVARDWRHVHFRSAARLVFYTVLGIPVGLLLLKTASETMMKAALALIILTFSAYSIFRRQKLVLENDRFAWLFGFSAGIFGGAYGTNGPPLAIYGSLRGWPADRFRATLQAYFFPASLLGMCGYGITGLWTVEVNRLFLQVLPAIVIGIFVGRFSNQKISAHRFNHFLHGGLIIIGILLLVQAIRF